MVESTRPVTPGPVAVAGSAVRLFREGLWLRLFLAVVALSLLFVALGRWQLHRYEAKVARAAVIDANYSRPPVALGTVLPGTSSRLPAGRQWTPVEVSGTYEADAQVLVRNRPLDGDYGYEVVVPLRTPSGEALLVDRGWVPPGQGFVAPEAVPPPPRGPVTVVVRLRPGEPPADRQPPPGQELRIDVPRIAARVGGEVHRGAYGVLAAERPAPAAAPLPLPGPDRGLGPHLAYAIQWWSGALAAWVLLGRYAVLEARHRVGGPARGPVRVRRPGRGAGRGPSDEEIEDAVEPRRAQSF